MPIPSSGAVKMSDINTELGRTSTSSNTELSKQANGTYVSINSNSSDKPDGVAPYAMSEWRGYNHSATTSFTSFAGSGIWGSAFEACQDAKSNNTYYHNGSGILPIVGDSIYTDSAGNNPINFQSVRLVSTNTYVNTGFGGVISAAGSCGRSERNLKYNIQLVGNSSMGIPIYHFNYINPKHGQGRFMGTMVDDLQKMGYDDAIFEVNGELWVDYGKIDVEFKSI
jgi:hypothetical protein